MATGGQYVTMLLADTGHVFVCSISECRHSVKGTAHSPQYNNMAHSTCQQATPKAYIQCQEHYSQWRNCCDNTANSSCQQTAPHAYSVKTIHYLQWKSTATYSIVWSHTRWGAEVCFDFHNTFLVCYTSCTLPWKYSIRKFLCICYNKSSEFLVALNQLVYHKSQGSSHSGCHTLGGVSM